MIKLLKKIFTVKEEPLPEKGEIRYLRNDSPWPTKNSQKVEVLDVKDGWVRYDMLDNMFKDQRMTLDSFIYCYKKEDK